jgi:hypothetical protein
VNDNLAIMIDWDGTEHRGVFRLYPANEETGDLISSSGWSQVQTEYWYGTGFSEDFETKREAQGDAELLARKLARDIGATWCTNY